MNKRKPQMFPNGLSCLERYSVASYETTYFFRPSCRTIYFCHSLLEDCRTEQLFGGAWPLSFVRWVGRLCPSPAAAGLTSII